MDATLITFRTFNPIHLYSYDFKSTNYTVRPQGFSSLLRYCGLAAQSTATSRRNQYLGPIMAEFAISDPKHPKIVWSGNRCDLRLPTGTRCDLWLLLVSPCIPLPGNCYFKSEIEIRNINLKFMGERLSPLPLGHCVVCQPFTQNPIPLSPYQNPPWPFRYQKLFLA